MQFDATGASLPDLFRSLNVDPKEKEALIRLAETVRRLEHEREYQQMLFGERPPPPPPPPPPSLTSRRRTPLGWLYVVRGTPMLATGGLVNWLLRARWHRVLAASVGSVVLAGSTLAPDLVHPAAAPPAQASVRHRQHAEHHRRVPAPVELPAVVPPRRKRRGVDSRTVAPSPSPSPAGPSPDPAPTDPGPSPLPSVTTPPVPTPTCTILHGKHCHGGDVVGDVVGALRGLPAYHDLS